MPEAQRVKRKRRWDVTADGTVVQPPTIGTGAISNPSATPKSDTAYPCLHGRYDVGLPVTTPLATSASAGTPSAQPDKSSTVSTPAGTIRAPSTNNAPAAGGSYFDKLMAVPLAEIEQGRLPKRPFRRPGPPPAAFRSNKSGPKINSTSASSAKKAGAPAHQQTSPPRPSVTTADGPPSKVTSVSSAGQSSTAATHAPDTTGAATGSRPAESNDHRYIQDKVFVGIKPDRAFDLRERLLGPGGVFLQHIQSTTGAKVILRGRGSGYIEPTSGTEAFEPIYLYITCYRAEGAKTARQMCQDLVKTVGDQYETFKSVMESATSPPNGAVAAPPTPVNPYGAAYVPHPVGYGGHYPAAPPYQFDYGGYAYAGYPPLPYTGLPPAIDSGPGAASYTAPPPAGLNPYNVYNQGHQATAPQAAAAPPKPQKDPLLASLGRARSPPTRSRHNPDVHAARHGGGAGKYSFAPPPSSYGPR
ncbi:hypothetical protein IWQ60_010771 [Tieghemiomyces parasiticus]|uniref:KHDC4/BBP-like KH-domain type I domain-containing protein n=1 Tax=Tieghemiomyces parasiticus TaxID=78921 RepID=A0A9W7ZIV9_9FUNG|nr:hypothetical protein IWQ60_010771 [Tieghemiomyces parasiticus]